MALQSLIQKFQTEAADSRPANAIAELLDCREDLDGAGFLLAAHNLKNESRNMSQLAPIRAQSRSCRKCRDCYGTMRLFGIEPHPTIEATDLLTYVCTHCDGVETEIVAPAKLKPTKSLVAQKAFDAETTNVLGSAFDAAWERLEAINLLPADKGQAASMRESLARFVIAAVEQGESDPHRVMEKALLRLKIILRRDVGVGGV
jgi:hypothetical protein